MVYSSLCKSHSSTVYFCGCAFFFSSAMQFYISGGDSSFCDVYTSGLWEQFKSCNLPCRLQLYQPWRRWWISTCFLRLHPWRSRPNKMPFRWCAGIDHHLWRCLDLDIKLASQLSCGQRIHFIMKALGIMASSLCKYFKEFILHQYAFVVVPFFSSAVQFYISGGDSSFCDVYTTGLWEQFQSCNLPCRLQLHQPWRRWWISTCFLQLHPWQSRPNKMPFRWRAGINHQLQRCLDLPIHTVNMIFLF